MKKYELIEQEIKWCLSHRGIKSEEFEEGFIAGLQQALMLMKSSPTRIDYREYKLVDLDKTSQGA